MKNLPISGNAQQYAILLGAAVVGVIVLYYVAKREVGQAAGAAKDVLTGKKNLLGDDTAGTVYGDVHAGIFSSLGSTANEVSGGSLQAIGDSSAVGWIADHIGGFFGGSYNNYDPNAAPQKTTPAGSPWSQLDNSP